MSGFQTTDWSLVLAARDEPSGAGDAALEALCEAYWYPLYACVRARGYDPDEAKDLTQEYFALLLEKDFLGAVEQESGRFRSFLLASLKNFLSHERDKARALKRGGGNRPLSLDTEFAEDRFRAEPAARLSPEEIFERRWALTVLERALDRMRSELVAKGEEERFGRLKQFLVGGSPRPSYREVAAELEMTEGAVKMVVHRLRLRLGALLREEISQTVAQSGDVEEEVRHLIGVLGQSSRDP